MILSIAAWKTVVEVVGSNPTRSIYFILVNYGIEWSSLLVSGVQNLHFVSIDKSDRRKFLVRR
jgi:hypothetical protein